MTTPSSGLAAIASEDGTMTIYISNRLSVLEAVTFKDIFLATCDAIPSPRRIVLDFHKTEFMDSTGVGSLVACYKKARSQAIPVQLNQVQPAVMVVLELTGLDSVLAITPALPKAVDPEPHPKRRDENYHPPATHPSVRSWLKRLMDILGALIGLAITGVLFIPIAIAIRWDSPGPILFCQTRCGWLGRHFRLWKFRSMIINAEARRGEVKNEAEGAFFKNAADPRITRVGRFLRRTSLDEFPQFWNVLCGDMSLVGTRPPTPDEVERYEIPQWQRLDVRPGMTGEWQVNGRSTVKRFEDVINLDLAYQKNWSLVYDLKLILKTIFVLFNRNSGAM